MKVVKGSEMSVVDQTIINHIGIPGMVLMEQAAMSCVEQLIRQPLVHQQTGLIICGTGNNGGDGLAIARLLLQREIMCEVYILGQESKLSQDAKQNYDALKFFTNNIYFINDDETASNLLLKAQRSTWIVDAIFGTGLKNSISGFRKTIIEHMNKIGGYILSVDIPSGVQGNSGRVSDSVINADETVTFGYPKVGNLLYPGALYQGKLTIGTLTIPKNIPIVEEIKRTCFWNEEYKNYLPKRSERSHKGTYGKVSIVAGSENMSGAAILSGRAAYRTGCGLVELIIPKKIQKVIQQALPEAITTPYDVEGDAICKADLNKITKSIESAKAVVIGPGMGTQFYAKEILKTVMKTNQKVPLIMDADALNILAKNTEWMDSVDYPVVMTPHLLEASRLSGIEVSEIKENMLDIASQISEDYHSVVVLKDARTIVSNAKGNQYINLSGNNGMATAGMGDVLTGVIGSLLAQGLDAYDGACLGTYLHGKAGDSLLSKRKGYSIMASDLINSIGGIL